MGAESTIGRSGFERNASREDSLAGVIDAAMPAKPSSAAPHGRKLYLGRVDEARLGFGCAGMSPLPSSYANPRRPPFAGCDRKDSEVSRFAIARSTSFHRPHANS